MNLRAESSRVSTHTAGPWRLAVFWLVSGMVAAALTIIAHELGHFFAGLTFKHPGVVLHYASVSSGAEKAGYPSWQLATVAAAGPLVTCAIVILCCHLAVRYRPTSLLVAVGMCAPVKFVVGFVFVYYWLSGARNTSPNFDEFNIAKHLDISPFIPILVGAVFLVGGWVWLIRSVPRVSRIPAVVSSMVGAAGGFALYLGVIGPRLLP